MHHTAEALLLPSLEYIRQELQMPEGATVGRLTSKGGGPNRDLGSFAGHLTERSTRKVPPREDIERAIAIATVINGMLAPEIEISPKETICNPEWLAEYYPQTRKATEVMARVYMQAANRYVYTEYVNQHYARHILCQVAAEHIVGRAVTPMVKRSPLKHPDPATFYNPFTIAGLRFNYPATYISDQRFFTALSVSSLRKHETDELIIAMHESDEKNYWRIYKAFTTARNR